MLDTVAADGGRHCTARTLEDYGNGKFQFSAAEIADGKIRRQNGIFDFEGTERSDGDGGTLTFVRVDAHRYAMVSKGTLRATAMVTLSEDGALLTERSDGTYDGKPFRSVLVLKRSDGTCEMAK